MYIFHIHLWLIVSKVIFSQKNIILQMYILDWLNILSLLVI